MSKLIVRYRTVDSREHFVEEFTDRQQARNLMRRVNADEHHIAVRVEGTRAFFVGSGGVLCHHR